MLAPCGDVIRSTSGLNSINTYTAAYKFFAWIWRVVRTSSSWSVRPARVCKDPQWDAVNRCRADRFTPRRKPGMTFKTLISDSRNHGPWLVRLISSDNETKGPRQSTSASLQGSWYNKTGVIPARHMWSYNRRWWVWKSKALTTVSHPH